MKYVAFLDILGFKSVLRKMKQHEATHYISEFSSTAFFEWDKVKPRSLEGYIVSDSFIIYSKDASESALNELLYLVDRICKEEFSTNSVLIRGAIASGDFDRLEARELASLRKGLIVGQAYVDAYLLESTVKVPGIVLSEAVYHDAQNIPVFSKNIFEEKTKNAISFIYRYLSSDYLLEEEKLCKFIQLAQNSKWMPHYYNAIYFALKHEENNKKVDQIFSNIFNIICEGNPSENWRDIDTFISNAFNEDVVGGLQMRLLRYLRQKLF